MRVKASSALALGASRHSCRAVSAIQAHPMIISTLWIRPSTTGKPAYSANGTTKVLNRKSYHKDERSSKPGVRRPTTMLRVGSEAPGQYEAHGGEHHIKEQQTVDPVDPAVPGLQAATEGSTRRISLAGVDHKHPGYQ